MKLIKEGKLQPRKDNEEIITLPSQYRKISKDGGSVLISADKKFILFFTHDSAIDSFAGFVYSEDDLPPGESLSKGIRNIERIEPKWYRIEAF